VDRTGRQYVRKLDDALASRSEGPRMFSQKDYRLATSWYEQGVPLGLILDLLSRRKVAARSLSQIASRVEESWKAVCAGKLQADSGPETVAAGDEGPELQLARALEEAPPTSGLYSLLIQLLEDFRAGEAPETLERLIDQELRGAVRPEQLQEAEEQARNGMESHRRRMPPEVFRETIRKAILARLRRMTGIPRFR